LVYLPRRRGGKGPSTFLGSVFLGLVACGDPIPEAWVLRGDGLGLIVTSAPYGLRLLDGQGRAVLETAGEGAADGYGSLAWTTGETRWSALLSPGWFDFEAHLDPWRDAWDVTEARVSPSGRALELVLEARGDGEARPVLVVHDISKGFLRVEASLEGLGENPRAWSTAFLSPPDEAFLGFGERFNRTNQRGMSLYNWAEEGGIGAGEGSEAGPTNPFPNGEGMSYFPVPFFLSTRGYGFWLDTTWRSQFDLVSERDDAWRVWHIGDRMAFEVYVPTGDTGAPWPYEVLDRFTARTGRPMIPPPWAFGPRRRVGRGSMQGDVSEIQAMRDEDLAITAVDDAVHFLPRGSHVGVEEQLRAWTRAARDLGYRVCGYYNPYIEDSEENPLAEVLQEGKEKGYFLKDADGSWSDSWLISGSLVTILTVDFTFPEATAWYQAMLSWAIDLGYSGWMYDFGEYVQPDVLTRSGESGEEHHNRFPLLYHKAAYDALESGPAAGDWLTFVRSGYTGDAAWSPFTWSGDPAASFEDSDGLPSMVRGGLNMGLSGVPNWGGDIGGFHCVADGYSAADEELLVRWIQQGSMTPNMQDQNACKSAFDEGEKADIFSSALGREAWRTWARLHTRLFPYLFSLATEAHQTGAPIMRQFFLEHPEDPTLADVDDAWYLGPALLVAPVLERGARARRLRLPEGLFLEWDTARISAGPGEIVLDAPLDRLPLLLREGRLLPLLDPRIDTLSDEDDPEIVGPGDVAGVLDVVAFLAVGGAPAEFTLYDGTRLEASWSGTLELAEVPEAPSEVALLDCGTCRLDEPLGEGLTRLRLTLPARDACFDAGGLRLCAATHRATRWDLYLLGGPARSGGPAIERDRGE
jgi:alpha-glucosidase (family GH31 glycosyl hydrolase)